MKDTEITYRLKVMGHIPSKSNSYKIGTISGHGTLLKTDRLKRYEEMFVSQCVGRRSKDDALIKGFFALKVDVFLPNRTQDLDNTLKILLDCLQMCGIIKNDCKCLSIDANRYYDKLQPRVELEVKEVFNG